MTDRALRFDLLGRDKTLGRTLGQAEGKFKRFGGAALKMGTVISGAFAGLAIGGFLKDAVDEAREAQRVGRQTAAVLKATGGAAKVSARDVDRLATALSNKAGVDDELIASGANLLLTFKGVRNEAGKGNRIFDQASSAILDMTAAMNNGEVSASGLKTSTIQVGKALNDPIKGMTALTRVGVTFTQKQKDQIKTLVEAGDKMGAQKIILAELKSEFGGAAAAAADPWQRFSVVMGNLKEQLGTALLPVLTTVANFLAERLPGAFQTAQRLLKPLIQGAQALVAAFRDPDVTSEGFIGFMERVGSAARGLYDTGREAAGRLVRGIQTKLDEYKPKLALFRDNLVAGVKRLGQPILNAIGVALDTGDYGPLGRAVGNALVEILRNAGNLATDIGGWVAEQFAKVDWVDVGNTVGKTAFPFAIGFVTTMFDGLWTAAREHPFQTAGFVISLLGVGKIGGIIAKVLSKIPFLRVFAPLFEGLNKLTAPVNNAIGKLAGFIGTAFREGLARVFPSVGKSLQGRLGKMIGDALAWLALRAEVFTKAGGKLIRNLAIGIGENVGLVLKNIGQVIAAITRPFLRSGVWLVRAGGQVVTGLIRGVEAVGRGVGRVALRVIEFLTRPFRPAAGWLIRRGRETIQGLGQGIVAKLGDVTAWMGRVKDRVTAPFGNAIRWLYQRGRDVLHGFWEGLTSKWQNVKDWILGIPKWIREHKGPLSLDRKLLVPAGAAIMGGFAKGLRSGASGAMDFVKGIVGNIWGFISGFGGARGGGSGSWNRAIQELIKDKIPYQIISTFRAGARTRASGSVSYHALNRAVDLVGPNMMAIWKALLDTGPTELIYSRAPFYIASGIAKAISQLDPITRADHYSHVHAAYEKGAWKLAADQLAHLHKGEMVVPAGPAEQIRRGTGRPEPLVPAQQGHITVNVTVNGVVGAPRDIARVLVPEIRQGLKDAQRRAGVPATQQIR